MEPIFVAALSKTASSLVIQKIMGLLSRQAKRPIKAAKEKFLSAWGTPPPELAAVLQDVIAKAYVATIVDLVNGYLDEQNTKTFRGPGEIENDEKLREASKALQEKQSYEIAPSIETIDILPAKHTDEDGELLGTLTTLVGQTFGDLPQDLERKLQSRLVPTLTEKLWYQMTRSLEDKEGQRIVYAFLFQGLSRIGESVENAESYARKAVDQIVELSSQVSDIKEGGEHARQEWVERIEKGKEQYRQWLIQSNETFLVAGLNIRLPIQETWDELLIDVPPDQTYANESLARQISRYHEWERLADTSRRGSTVYGATAALIGKQHLVIVGGPGSGKSTLSRWLCVEAARKGALAIRISLKQIAGLLRGGSTFDAALLAAACDKSGISDDVVNDVLAAPDFLIADGLDECDPSRVDMANNLAAWASGHPNCNVCVLTRPVGHTPGLLPGFSQAELLPLNYTAIKELAAKLISAKVSDPGRRERLTSEFSRVVVDNNEKVRVASIAARNPLLLSFLLALFVEDKPLTNRRAKLFEQIIDLMRRSPLSDRMTTVEVDAALAERVIEVGAWHLLSSPDIDLKTLSNDVARDLEVQCDAPPLRAKRLAEEAFMFWEEHRLIERLTLGPSEAYTFVHLSLEEYLAGLYISHMKDDELHSWLSEVRRKIRWRQPILLASGAGAADRIVPVLLEFDEPTDLTSIEAMVGASCISEAGQVTNRLAEQVTDKLRHRLTSKIPLIAVEAGEGLRQLAPLAPDIVSSITAGLLEHEQEWTRLAAFTARLASGQQYVTLDQIRKWISEVEFVRVIHYLGEPAEERISDMPEQAYDLQEFAFVTGIGRLFEELSLEEAREEAKGYIKQVRDTMQNSGMLGPLELMLDRYQSGDLVDVAFEDIFAAHPGPQQADDSCSPDAVLIEVISAAATECLSTNDQTPSDYSETDFTNLSKLITGLQFLNVGFTAFHILAKRQEEIAFQEVVRGVIFVLGLDPNAVLSEARTALARLNEPEKPSLTEFIRNIPVNIKWKRAKDAHLDPARLISALSHPSWVVVEAAMNLLLGGVSSEELRPLTLQSLDAEGNHIIPAVAGLVSRLWKPDEAARILLNRLKGKPVVGFGHVYEALVQLIPGCEAPVQNEIAWALLKGLYDDEPAAAVSAAETLSVLPLLKNPELQQYIKQAFEYWMERVKREDLEASAHVVGSGKYRSSFRVVEPDPLVTLMKILTQLDALDTEELLILCSAMGELASEAVRLLTGFAASDSDLMRSLLVRIKDGLKPYPSSTAFNLLDALLGLPRETLRPVETELLAITGSEIPSIRARLISSLTSEWASHEAAVNLAQAAIDDPAPGVRNSAVQTLRLLKHPS